MICSMTANSLWTIDGAALPGKAGAPYILYVPSLLPRSLVAQQQLVILPGEQTLYQVQVQVDMWMTNNDISHIILFLLH